jgi:hypothetical protein
MKTINFVLEESLYQYFDVKFGGESDGDDFETQKRYLNLLNDL